MFQGKAAKMQACVVNESSSGVHEETLSTPMFGNRPNFRGADLGIAVAQLNHLAVCVGKGNCRTSQGNPPDLESLKTLRDSLSRVTQAVCKAMDRETQEFLQGRRKEWEAMEASYRRERKTLEVAHKQNLAAAADAARREVSKEREEKMCRICFVNPRNAVVLTCMHFHYCSECLNAHKQGNGRCPTCRGKMSGVCDLNL